MDFIHTFIPSTDAKDRRTVILLHGTGGDESDLLPLGRMLAPGAALLGIRGKVSERGAARFFRRIAEGVFDEQDLIFRTHELADFLEVAIDRYGLDASQLTALGYSNGANIAASLLLLRPSVLANAVLFRAMVPLIPQSLPDLRNTRVVMFCGNRDPIIPQTNSEQLADLLRNAAADVMLYWQNTGHGLVNAEIEQAREWVASNTTK